jgi:hypothetical protein
MDTAVALLVDTVLDTDKNNNKHRLNHHHLPLRVRMGVWAIVSVEECHNTVNHLLLHKNLLL